MMYSLEFLGPPKGDKPFLIWKIEHDARSLEQAVTTAMDVFLDRAPDEARGFRLIDQAGQQVHLWYRESQYAA